LYIVNFILKELAIKENKVNYKYHKNVISKRF